MPKNQVRNTLNIKNRLFVDLIYNLFINSDILTW